MTAPTLLLLAPGTADPRWTRTVCEVRDRIRSMRADLRVEATLVGGCSSGPARILDRLAADGVEEVVAVPLLLTADPAAAADAAGAAGARTDAAFLLAGAAATRPDIRVEVSDVLGTRRGFLGVLDRRLRTALARARVRELDALVLAAPGSSDPVATAGVVRIARAWGWHHRLPVLAAYASTTPPSTGEAVRAFRAEGRRHIAVGSLFLGPGVHLDRAAELAMEAGAVAVSEPLGADEEVGRAVLERYAVGAVDLVPLPA